MSYASRLQDGHIAIYLLHGVIERQTALVRNYTRKHLERDYFAAFIRELRAAGTPISMDDVLRYSRDGGPLPPRPFAITFDDGFHNNLSVAAPVLAEQNVPATFYVTSSFVDQNRMGWIDRIEYAIERRPSGSLELPWGRRDYSGVENSKALLSEIRRHVKQDRRLEPDDVASDIQRQLGFEPVFCSDDPLDRKLTWDEVRELDSDPLFTVAGHSHTHRILEYLDDATLQWEIDTSIGLLRDKSGIVSRHYSYPEGMQYCYSQRVIDCLRSRGVECSPSAEDGVNAVPADPFHLKRIMVV